MTINITYSQFLFGSGVQRKQADAVGEKIASKIWKREPLTQDEAALTAAYLNRPGANETAERHVGVAMLTSNLRAAVDPKSTSDLPVVPNASVLGFTNVSVGANNRSSGRVPAHTPEWTDHHPSDPGHASVKVHGLDVVNKERTEIRMLAARVAAAAASPR